VAKKKLNKAQGGDNILPNYNVPMQEYQRPFINPYGYSFSPEQNPNVKIYGLGAEAQYDVNDRLNIHGGLNTQSVLYPGGSDMFMKPTYNVGLTYKFEKGGWLEKYNDGGPVQENYNDNTTSYPPGFVGMGYNTQGRNYSPAWGGQFAMGGSIPGSVGFTYARTNSPAPSEGPYAKKTLPSAQNGQEMSFYQHGLDWTPRNISRNGDDIPKNQNAQYVLPRFDMPRVASESTSRTFFDPVTKKEKSTATVGQKKKNLQLSSEAMGKSKKAEREREKAEEKARIAERKAAVAAKDKGEAFTLPTGERLTYDQMSPREQMYVSGKALEQRGRFNENEESFFDEWLNPLGYITGAAAGLAEAPLEAKLSDSNLPYIGAVANPLIEGMFGFDPLGSAMKLPGKVAQSMESGLLSNIPGPKTITLSKMLNNSKLNKTLADNLYANRILEEELIAPNVSYKGTPNFPEGKIINHYGTPFLQKNGRMYYMAEFENGFGLNDATYDFMPRPDYKYPSKHIKNLQKKYNVSDAAESEFNSIYDNYYPFDQTVTPVDDWIIHNDFGQIKGDKTWWKKSSPYKGITARTLFDKPVGRHLFTKQSSLESFLKKPLDQHRELIGDVIKKGDVPREGITITPNVEKSLEDIEGLKSFTYNPITKSMERGIYDPLVRSRIRTDPDVIQNWLKTFKKITKQKEGGVIKDNMGYWNPENWGKVVEIDSPDITMRGVTTHDLLAISDTGDVQYMEREKPGKPGKDYKFKGKKVKEYPVAQKGKKVSIDGKEYDTTSEEYKDMLDEGVVGTMKDGVFYGNKSDLRPVVIASSKDKDTQEFYNKLKEGSLNDYESLIELGQKYGPAPHVTMLDKPGLFSSKYTNNENEVRPSYNPFTQRMYLGKNNSDLREGYLSELAHHKQLMEKGATDFILRGAKLLPRIIKNKIDPTKQGYEEEYSIPGSIENEAHEDIEYKLKQELYDLYWKKRAEGDYYRSPGHLYFSKPDTKFKKGGWLDKYN
jgi:hypothetical protein